MRDNRIVTVRVAVLTAVLIMVSGCFLNWGKRLEFNGGEIYYTPEVTEEEATRLGEYMIDSGFFDGNEKTVQITKNGTTYEFRMVIKEGLDQDEEYLWIAGIYSLELSENVFEGNRTDIHLCDEHLETLQVIAALEFNGGQLFYLSGVTSDEAVRLGEYLVASGFYDGNEKSVLLSKTGEVFEFYMITRAGLDTDPEYITVAEAFTGELSENVFNGSQVDIYFCDSDLQTLLVITGE